MGKPKIQPIVFNPGQDEVKTVANEMTVAYVDDNGLLYIKTPASDTYTIRESIEHYNNRSGSISFIKTNEIDIRGLRQVYIDSKTLTINNDLNESENTGPMQQTPMGINP